MLELFVLLQIKHFLCDFPFQNKYMLGKFAVWPEFVKPLAAHSAVHAGASFLVALIFAPRLCLWWAVIDFVTHFVIDRLKADKTLLGRWGMDNKFYWWALGLDQLLHQLVYVRMIKMTISL